MNKKLFSINKIICLFFIAFCFMFVTCKEPGGHNKDNNDNNNSNNDDDDDYENPNAGIVRELIFSNDSGLYPAQFDLTITADGSEIYYTTDGSVPVPNKAGTIKYSAPITVKNRNGEANVLATKENSKNFYGEPHDRGDNMPTAFIPTKDQVPKATVIRVIAVNSSGVKSGVATKTYFIGNNLSDYGSTRIISLVSDPDNLVSEDKGIMVRGKSTNRWDPPKDPYNFQRKGADWERDAYLELFEGNASSRNRALSTGVGIRVRGGWSRAIGQKSFTVYFKEQYGIKNLKDYNLIPKDDTLGTTGAVKADGKTPVAQYKSFMLRNGANDCDYTKFYDVFLQDLLSDRSFATQASVPCVVYLNGEYWGPYNMQERYSDNHTEYKYGVDKDNVISYDNGELDDGNPGEEALFRQMVNMTDYNEFCKLVDIDNFIDYWASEIYIYNEDWPQNNYRIWRTRNAEPGNPYGDKKWRYEMFDTEFAMGIYSSGGLTGNGVNKDAFAKILDGEYKNHENNKLFAALLKNPDFCKKFVNTMMDLYNLNFHPDNYLPKLNKYAAVYKPLMNGYFKRWGYPGTWTSVYQNKVDDAKTYLNDIRNAMVNNYLPAYFGTGTSGIANIGVTSGSLRDVSFAVTGANASIKINTITPNFASGSWTGKYYSSVPITVTASAPPSGYEFDGWTITGGSPASSPEQTITVTLTGNAQIVAKYKLTGSTIVPVSSVSVSPTTLNLKIGETSTLSASVSPSNATYKTITWISENSGIASVNNGKVTAVSPGTVSITASTVEGKKAICTVTVKEPTVLLDLAKELQKLSVQTIDSSSKFNTAFGGLPINPGSSIDFYTDDTEGEVRNVTYQIIKDESVNKLQVNDFVKWSPGLDITSDIVFKAGDIIEVKVKYINGPNNFVLNVNLSGWDVFWEERANNSGDVIHRTYTLTAGNASKINANKGSESWAYSVLKLKTGGIDPWRGYIPEGVGSYLIEQLKISRIE